MTISATTVWRVRPSGNNLNGGGYDASIAGAGTDYSKQNAAQASGSNGATSGAGSTTFTDSTAAAFTSAMVGNCIQIASGTNFQAGFYFVTAFTNANSVVLDRTPSSGGAGSAAVWKLGGGWADFWTNTTTSGPLVQGNTIFILGSGTPNPSSYIYDYTVTSAFTSKGGGFTPPTMIRYANDPETPGYKAPPDTTGGMPCVRVNTGAASFFTFGGFNSIAGVWFVTNGMSSGQNVIVGGIVYGCVLDQFGVATGIIKTGSAVIASEVFSSVGAAFSDTYGIFETPAYFNNVHDCIGGGIRVNPTAVGNIVAKCQGNGLATLAGNQMYIINNTIDGNLKDGIVFSSGWIAAASPTINNIISNHVVAGKFGINTTNTLTATDMLTVGPNVYYNNTTDISAPYNPLDTHGGSNPYVGQTTENYTLA